MTLIISLESYINIDLEKILEKKIMYYILVNVFENRSKLRFLQNMKQGKLYI